ncbi:DoxX family protein, partial [Candidatus Woesearchaeota archaeon]|nr:DoxX family protein [Candidatus Woesearchaeota archaeon]
MIAMQWGLFLLRILISFVFIFTGTGKLFMGVKPVELVGSILYKLGLSVIPATTFVMVLGIIELLIGLMLFFGLFTRIVAW